MITFSKAEDYAVVLMATLAFYYEGESWVSLRDVADGQHLPYLFLNKIATNLKKAGLLESKEGVGGGYRLKKDPKKITLAEIVRAVSVKNISSCISGHQCANEGICPAQTIWTKIEKILGDSLAKITLNEVIREYYKKAKNPKL